MCQSRWACEDTKSDGPVLYEESNAAIILLDGPTSITLAQGHHGDRSARRLLSSAAPESPFSPPEPKSDAALARVRERSTALTDPQAHRDLIKSGLEQIKRNYHDPWCKSRRVRDPSDGVEEPELKITPLKGNTPILELPKGPRMMTLQSTASLGNNILSNPHSSSASIHVSSPATKYHIPPRATFIATSISSETVSTLSKALLTAAPEPSPSAAPGQFDLILLDPPWPNRSARRSAGYRRAKHAADAFCGFQEISLTHLAPNGAVACWITHAENVRTEVERLFEDCGLRVEEEWIWVKVTASGEPLVPLDSNWRRAWEVLLIGRIPEGDAKDAEPGQGGEEATFRLKRRLIVSVPDVHSRKPCLKSLFEKYILKGNDKRVLEVFGRHLVSGWCTIGDEPIRFNWDGHWKTDASQTD